MQKIGQDGLAQGSVESIVIHYPELKTDFFKKDLWLSNYYYNRAWISVGLCSSFTENLFTLS